jgi:LuxR family maltose regulon positive regulatory protein
MELGAKAQENTIHSRALLQRAQIQHAAGRRKLAQADLTAADGIARRLQDQVILRSIIRQRALFAAEDGDLASARQWLQTLLQDGEGPFPFFQSYASGRLLLAEGKSKKAEAEFASALQSLQEADFVLVRIEVMVWQAVCLGKLGRIAEAGKVLKQAVKAAQTENVIRPFIEAREGLAPLIERSAGEGFAWLDESVHGDGRQAESLALTRREREILQLLAVGFSNQEMADRLVIAEGTLKRHIANLYQKLGVHNRAQAILHFHGG